MRVRFVRPLLIAALVLGGVLFYRATLRPEPMRLATWAEGALARPLRPGRHPRCGSIVDLLEGVRIAGLSVERPGEAGPSLFAREIDIRHDVLALTAGVPRLASVVLKGPRISAHETAEGEVELDFPFDPPRDDGSRAAPLPSIEIVDGVVPPRGPPELARSSARAR